MRETLNELEKAMLIFKSGGYFENGRWITPQSLAMEQMGNTPQPRFELVTHNAIPVFKQGVCTGYRKETIPLGTFTQAEIELIHIDTNEMSELANRTEIVPIQ